MSEMLCFLKMRFRNQFSLSQLKDQDKTLRTHALITVSGYGMAFVLMLSYAAGLVYQMEISNEITVFHQYLFSLLFWVFGIWTLLSGVKNTFVSSDVKQIAVLPLPIWQTRLLNLFSRLALQIGLAFSVVLASQICFYLYHPFALIHIGVLVCYTIFTPIVAMLVATVIALIIRYLFVTLKIKSVMSEAIMVLAIFLMPLIYAYIDGKKLDLKSGFIATSLVRTSWIGAMESSTFWFALALLGCGCCGVLLICVIFVKYYAAFEALFFEKAMTKKTRLQVKRALPMLVQKELAQYKSSFTYVSNTILGPAILLIVSCLLLFGVVPSFSTISLYQVEITNTVIYYGIFIACIGLTTTTACSFSMEGKKIWLSRSLPVTIFDLSLGKGAINVLLFLPGLVIATFDCAIVFGFTGFDFFGFVALLFIYLLCVTSLGLYANLKFPKYDWLNEMAVVKQSEAIIVTAIVSITLISIMFGVIVTCGIIGIYLLSGVEMLLTLCFLLKIKQMQYL